MHERIRDRFLGLWGRTVASWPVATLTICVALAAVSIVVTVMCLEFRADRSELIDSELSWNQRYARYKERFPRWNDVYVVLDGTPGDERVNTLAATIARKLRADERVAAADAGFDQSEAGPKLFAIAPLEQFAEALQELGQARRLAAAANANAALGLLLTAAQSQQGDPEALLGLEQFLSPFLRQRTTSRQTLPFSHPIKPNGSRWSAETAPAGCGLFACSLPTVRMA